MKLKNVEGVKQIVFFFDGLVTVLRKVLLNFFLWFIDCVVWLFSDIEFPMFKEVVSK